ncbi:alpha/beta fold hydrolase [Heyndrickxia acidicola]|uniref:Alpha/beta hydrolase n=1 Tax=Heyndrickxia acidicola TaxID=209389 RepID=A0ABU6MIV9_9BACI|nr:alpha/beta hydrolase [Heyndrickxia acidicola]MED1203177.1 alpha/beta hydrolase [Heyndrickxia acidicola]
MPAFISNGARLYFKEDGEGAPLILLHGLHGSSRMLKKEISQLKEHFRVIALDARGHGESDKPQHYTMEDHIQDVVNLLNHLKLEKVFLLGISMGSYIAQGVASAYPKRVEKLVLVVPKGHGKTSSMQELLDRHAQELEGLSFAEQFSYVSKYIFHSSAAIQNAFSEFYADKAMLTSPQEQDASNKAIEGFNFLKDLEKITAKTLVISGKYDGLNPPERGKEVASRIPDAAFIEFMHSGHGPSIEEPERFKKEVINFLSEENKN